ncbi:MAG: ATP-binding cassette domain-containing protein [Alicyclobacillus herbarius]|nr:ATP-binding cassette domain-containing protein [Alicyclobacillus herbarius]
MFPQARRRRLRLPWRRVPPAELTTTKAGSDSAGVKVALHPIDFQVAAGETIAFIGPNGAGKSTTIKMLTGILHPSSGTASVLGLCPWQERVQLSYRIGTVFGQKSQLWYHLPPRDTFDLMASIYDLPKTEYRRRRDELVERFQLSALMDTPVRRLSLGERMRCEIAVSFLHRPRILFLDEPTIGLDVVVKQTIRELIRDLNQQEGVTVFLTSHDATDVESLCRRVLVINQGRLLFDGPTTQLVNRFLHYKEVYLQLQEPGFDLACEGVEVQTLEPARIKLVVDVKRVRVDQLLADILLHHSVRDVSVQEPSMEDIIRNIYLETSPMTADVPPANPSMAGGPHGAVEGAS